MAVGLEVGLTTHAIEGILGIVGDTPEGIVKEKWTGSDEGLVRFNGCASGISEYSAKDLGTDWPAITKVVSALMDEDVSESDLLEMVVA